jgi:hypothetical protein
MTLEHDPGDDAGLAIMDRCGAPGIMVMGGVRGGP